MRAISNAVKLQNRLARCRQQVARSDEGAWSMIFAGVGSMNRSAVEGDAAKKSGIS